MRNAPTRPRRARYAGALPRGAALLVRLAFLALLAVPAGAFAQGTIAPKADATPPAASGPAAAPSAATAAPQEPAAPKTAPSLPSIGALQLPRDLSPWSMFVSADRLVQAVMIGLAFASVVTWTVWLAKNIELWAAMRRLRSALAMISSERSLDDAYASVSSQRGILPTLIDAAMLELQLSADLSDKAGIKERIATRLARLEVAASRDMNRGTGVLATIGATAPFVGLFGTVWGIMNSFIGISQGADDQPRRGRARDRRGAARHRHRPCRRDPRGGHL